MRNGIAKIHETATESEKKNTECGVQRAQECGNIGENQQENTDTDQAPRSEWRHGRDAWQAISRITAAT